MAGALSSSSLALHTLPLEVQRLPGSPAVSLLASTCCQKSSLSLIWFLAPEPGYSPRQKALPATIILIDLPLLRPFALVPHPSTLSTDLQSLFNHFATHCSIHSLTQEFAWDKGFDIIYYTSSSN